MTTIRKQQPWDFIRESAVTSESTYLDRRRLIKTLGLGMISGMLSLRKTLGQEDLRNIPPEWRDRWQKLFPAPENPSFHTERAVTDERIVTIYNNFYEFTSEKTKVREEVDLFEVHPWRVEVKGEISNPGTFDLDDLIRLADLEERIYHLRCVEAWSVNVPWTGYPLRELVKRVEPTSDAKWLRIKTAYRPHQMPGQRDRTYPWPYHEALSLEEATNELALLTFGLYGHPLNKQNGAPVRLILPWKFGFKSIKSIDEIEFVSRKPTTFWSRHSREYGFWGNVNPEFDHPRWSQATEVFLNTQERIPTRLYNGYGDYVAHLYDESDRDYFY